MLCSYSTVPEFRVFFFVFVIDVGFELRDFQRLAQLCKPVCYGLCHAHFREYSSWKSQSLSSVCKPTLNWEIETMARRPEAFRSFGTHTMRIGHVRNEMISAKLPCQRDR